VKLLAIDTSAHLCAACLYDVSLNKVIAEDTRDIGRGHAEILMGVIESCLKQSKLEYTDLNEIRVTIGPGSFTGVRVGMAVARGFALSLKIPAIGINTLEACAVLANQNSYNGKLVTLIDAKRGEAYCKIEDEAPFIISFEKLADQLKDKDIVLCGSGSAAFNQITGADHVILHKEATAPIALIASMKTKNKDMPLEPLYLRNADAKPQAGFILPHADA